MKKRKLSHVEKELIVAERELDDEKVKQLSIIYSCAAITLWKDFEWRRLKIMRRFRTSMLAYDECGSYGSEKSMLQMLEEETGIEMMLDGYDYSYHQFSYLDGNKWNRKLLPPAQLVLMRRKQKPWIAPSLLAGLCLALHRDEGFGEMRLSKFVAGVDRLRRELGDSDIGPYAVELKKVTGIDINELWNDREVWGE